MMNEVFEDAIEFLGEDIKRDADYILERTDIFGIGFEEWVKIAQFWMVQEEGHYLLNETMNKVRFPLYLDLKEAIKEENTGLFFGDTYSESDAIAAGWALDPKSSYYDEDDDTFRYATLVKFFTKDELKKELDGFASALRWMEKEENVG